MYKRIEKGPLKLKFWSDGYENDSFGTATHIAIQNNHPGDPEVESETDYFVLNQDTNTAYLYGKSLVVYHQEHDHTHFHFDILTNHFDDVETGLIVSDGDVKEYVLGIFAAKDFTVQFANPDDFEELGIDTTVPRTTDDLNRHTLEGYGFNETTGVPVFTFLVDADASPPVQWTPPLSHLINYTWHENGGTQRIGVMNNHNQTIGGWSGENGYNLIQALAEHEEYEIAIKEVTPDNRPIREESGGVEAEFLGNIEYGLAESGYQKVEDSPWSDYRNERGQTMLEMWEQNHNPTT